MIHEINQYLVSIAIGVRFRANFSIEDKLGNIVDRILYSRNSFFNPTFFPLVESGIDSKRLINEKNGNSLIINNSNIILEINCSEVLANLDDLHEHFDKDIINGIMKEFKIIQINRIGYVDRYLFAVESLAKTFLDKTIGKTLEGINDINLRFSKRVPIEEALVQRDVLDYYNVIFNIIKKSDKDDLFISLDYQRYYDPFLDSSTLVEFDKFIEKVHSFNHRSFLTWINNNYGEINATV